MVKLKKDAIGAGDLNEYLETTADFAFELRVLRLLTELGFACEHGGSYRDPVSKKTRQFDIRAWKRIDGSRVFLAVECKNVQDNCPLLVTCVPRLEKESFHEVLCGLGDSNQTQLKGFQSSAKNVRLRGVNSIYPSGGYVGKACAQVGRKTDESFFSDDRDVYDKWAQALSSASDLADRAYEQDADSGGTSLSVVIPFLALPDQNLWTTHFNVEGAATKTPGSVDRCSYFVDHYYYAGPQISGSPYTISHLEFVTLRGLKDAIRSLFDEAAVSPVFPRDQIFSQLYP